MPDPFAVHAPDRRIVGLGVRTSNSEEMNPETAAIPALWGQFLSEKVADQIPNRLEGGPLYGVYTQYEGGSEGYFRLIAGVEVESFEDVPEGFESVFVPGGEYEVFLAEDRQPQSILAAWQEIWRHYRSGKGRSRAFTADYEQYDPTDPDRVEIYVSVS